MPFHISPNLLKPFKGFCSSPEIIMLFVYMKCRFSLSYRDLEEMARIRGTTIDHQVCSSKYIQRSEGIKTQLVIAGEWTRPISKRISQTQSYGQI